MRPHLPKAGPFYKKSSSAWTAAGVLHAPINVYTATVTVRGCYGLFSNKFNKHEAPHSPVVTLIQLDVYKELALSEGCVLSATATNACYVAKRIIILINTAVPLRLPRPPVKPTSSTGKLRVNLIEWEQFECSSLSSHGHRQKQLHRNTRAAEVVRSLVSQTIDNKRVFIIYGQTD